MKFIDSPLIGTYVSRLVVNKIYFTYEIATAFLDACEETVHVFKESFPLNHENLHYVMDEVKENMDQAIAYIA